MTIILPIICLISILTVHLSDDNLSYHVYNREIYSIFVVAIISTWVGIRIYPGSEVPYMAMLVVCAAFIIVKLTTLILYAQPSGLSLGILESLIWLYAILVFALINITSPFYMQYSLSLMSILSLISAYYIYKSLNITDSNPSLIPLIQFNSIGWIIIVGSKGYMISRELYNSHTTRLATLEGMAHTDILTNLPNRRHLEHSLQSFLEQPDSKILSLLFIDLDGFKLVNDTLGHSKGDDVLKQVADLLLKLSGTSAVVGRLNGDEFVVLLPETTGEEAESIGFKILNQLQKDGLDLGREYRNFRLTLSIGISVYPEDGQTVEELLRHADSAMFAIKHSGKKNVRRYNLEDDAATEYRQELARDLAVALERREISLVFQPLYDLNTGKMTKTEVLMRWKHPTLGWISPATFIPVAEQSGLIPSLGYWVLQQSCNYASRWPSIIICVNVSVLQLIQTDFTQQVIDVLEENQLPANRLELELTETTLMEENPNTTETLLNLKATGISLAIDDFGIGYSNLARLRILPVDTLKIDQSFTKSLAGSELDQHYARQMIHSVVQISNIAHLQVTAEGIETFEQLQTVRSLGCRIGQGYFLSAPCSAEHLGALLNRTELPQWVTK